MDESALHFETTPFANAPPVPVTPDPARGERSMGPEWPLLCVVYLGRDYVVVDKPAGLFSVPGRGEHKQDSIATRAARVFPEAVGPLSVHRLDSETSGLMVLGLTRSAHRALSRQFMNRRTGKAYVAIVDGLVEEDRGEINLPMIVDWPNRPRQIVDFERGKPALTKYIVLERDESIGVTRLYMRPETGRTHQLRVHAAAPRDIGGLGAPILGDTLYGDPSKAPRLLLHAEFLAFWEPGTGRWVKFRSPPPF